MNNEQCDVVLGNRFDDVFGVGISLGNESVDIIGSDTNVDDELSPSKIYCKDNKIR